MLELKNFFLPYTLRDREASRDQPRNHPMHCQNIDHHKVLDPLRVSLEDTLGVIKVSSYVTRFLELCPKKQAPLIICIGTDRSTGDSLGPLTGMHLSTLLQGRDIKIYGTLDSPVHAVNLEQTLTRLKTERRQQPVIAIDACLGRSINVGSVLLEQAPLYPGAGLNKPLPEVGDFSISGVVNVSGFMEFQVLQNTRLNIVLKMSCLIAQGLYKALHQCTPVL